MRTERDKDLRRKRSAREKSKEVLIPRCENKRRRKRLEKDDEAWLRWYFDDPADSLSSRFWYPFTLQQREMIAAIRQAIVSGGDQAIAASRGEGKSTIAERLLTKYALTGAVSFAVLLAATGSRAEDSLQSIKGSIEDNARLLADYPEVCVPVRALEHTPNRAHYQVVTGRRHDNGKPYTKVPSRFSWCGQQVRLPNVPGAPATGGVIATRGLDAEVRGLNKFNRRVDVAVIDDPDTEETVNSQDQATKLEKRIDRAVAGLGGQQRGVARIMLTTLQRRECVSAKFTDPTQKPSWKGKRFRFLVTKPTRADLWDEYVQLWALDLQSGDIHARRAHKFYLDQRAAMEEGAAVANPNRFNPQILPDGSALEVSALQRYYNEVARIGQEAVSTEYDNDPPEESGLQESGISAHRIQGQMGGFARKEIPPGCLILTQGVDVRKIALHWVVRAWLIDEAKCLVTGYTIDYGVQDVWGTTAGSDEGLDDAVKRAILARKDTLDRSPYFDKAGNARKIDLTLIDAGWRTEAIYEACRTLGLDWKPAMGFGKSNGCVQASFRSPIHSSPDKKMGDRWFLSKRPKGTWLVCMDADFWKSWEHDRWMSDPNKAGAMLLFGEKSDRPDRMSQDQKGHFAYSKHLTSEVEVEEVVKGVLKRYWKAKSDSNHYLDASYMSNVAASMLGVRLVKSPVAQVVMDAGEWFKRK